jgi:ribonucleoside-diphosphate reductase alpha chain
VFRELAVSYMGRFDLAHVDPSESNFDAMGRGVEEGKQPEQPSNKYLSKGLTRSRTDNLVVMRSSSEPQTEARGSGNVTSMASHSAAARLPLCSRDLVDRHLVRDAAQRHASERWL